jgi:iron complex transport system permease protein
MHLNDGKVPEDYQSYLSRKVHWIIAGILLAFALFIMAISVGAVAIPPLDVIQTLIGTSTAVKWNQIVWNIRLPQALAAVIAGVGLAIAGVAMQSILRNPLASPFTLGISSAGAFGAAVSIVVLGTGNIQSTVANPVSISNPFLTTVVAFIFCMIATGIILLISHVKGASPEVMILTGVALSSLFSAGVMFLQYFSNDAQLAAVVFWTFGDVGRATWDMLPLMSVVVGAGTLYFIANRWNYNAIDAGDETAQGLGVNVVRVRLVGMTVAALISAVIVAMLGVIGFVGLVCPHMVRRIIGDDQRYLIPGSAVAGAILLLASDTVARVIVAPYVLPVAVLTAFMGAPVFIFLLFRGYKR